MPQLSIQLVDSVQTVRVDRPCTIGGPSADLPVPALGDLTLRVVPSAAGIVIASTTDPAEIGARGVAAGTSWLLRSGERATIRDVSLVALGDPPPDGTRELAGALLAGLDPSPPCGPGLLVLEGPDAGRRFPMGPRMLVGRGQGADVALDDPLVSRRHLRLERRGDVVLARDVASKNGVVVNGRRGGQRRLRVGDELRIGATLLVLDDPSATASTAPASRQRQVEGPSLDDSSPVEGRAISPLRAREVTAIALASCALLAGALLLARAAG